MTPIIRVRGLEKRYDSAVPTYALRSADLDVHEGEFVAIIGRSGSGKSSLLNVLGLLDTATGGSYEFEGYDMRMLRDAEADSLRGRDIGFVFQSSFALADETVERNVALGLEQHGVPRSEMESRVSSVLQSVGLSHRIGASARELSGGERQRLAIARAIVGEPKLLLADEPTGNLDSANASIVLDIFRAVAASGTTILMITHDAEAASVADRVVTLDDGVMAGGNAPELASARESGTPQRLEQRLKIPMTRKASIALSAITARWMGALALMIALGLGIGGLVAATGVSASASAQIAERLDQSALDQVVVYNTSSDTRAELAERRTQIGSLEFVERVGLRMSLAPATARVGTGAAGESQAGFSGVSATGADAQYLQLAEAVVNPESAVQLLDRESSTGVALIGANVAARSGLATSYQGRQVWVAGRAFDIVGIIVSSDREPLLMDSIVVSAQQLPPYPSELVVRTQLGFPSVVAEAIPLAIAPDAPGSISISTVADLRQLRAGVTTDLDALVGATGAVMLLVAVFGAAAATHLALQARRQEIALRRAFGASRRDVCALFVLEGAMVGLGAGLLGLAVGFMVIAAVAIMQGWSAVVPWSAPAAALPLGVLAGAVSSLWPAIRASRAEPADAIR